MSLETYSQPPEEYIFIGVCAVIKSNLGRLMGERKLKVADLARETGLSRKAVTLLYKETGTRVEFETLDALCQFLECKIGDLLEYVPKPPTPRKGKAT